MELSHWGTQLHGGSVQQSLYSHRHNLLLGASRSLFLFKAELVRFISSFGTFHLLYDTQPFFLHTLSETTLLILKIYVKVQSLVALIVYD